MLDTQTATRVIINFKEFLNSKLKEFGQGKRKTGGVVYDIIEEIDVKIRDHGEFIVGNALERIVPKHQKILEDPRYYYEVKGGSEIERDQDKEIEDFEKDLKEYIDEVLYELTISDLDTEEPKKPTKKEIKDEYKRERSNLLRMIRRRKARGVDLSELNIPKIPKTITEASIRVIQKVIDYLKDEYRYLDSRRGYRHSNDKIKFEK